MTTKQRKVNAPSKGAITANVWEYAKTDTRARNRALIHEEPKDILIAINTYAPGARNEMHFHVGTGQTFLVLKGTAEIRHRHKDLPKEETVTSTMDEGNCIVIPANVYYQLHNPGTEPLVLYQVKQPGELVSVEGKGILNPADYYTKAREEKGDLKEWEEPAT